MDRRFGTLIRAIVQGTGIAFLVYIFDIFSDSLHHPTGMQYIELLGPGLIVGFGGLFF